MARRVEKEQRRQRARQRERRQAWRDVPAGDEAVDDQAEQELEAGLIGSEESHLLKVPAGSAALFMRRTTYTERDLPIEYAKSIYCGNKYVFFTHMKREQLMP